jgi:hypothetical protein
MTAYLEWHTEAEHYRVNGYCRGPAWPESERRSSATIARESSHAFLGPRPWRALTAPRKPAPAAHNQQLTA